jgi:tetratricopeptide (TPR) repeat protein
MTSRIITTLFVLFTCTVCTFAQSHFDQAKAAADNSDYVEAVHHIRQAIKEAPREEKVLNLAVQIYTELEQYDTAMIYGDRLYDQDSDTREYVRTYAMALTRGGNPQLACTILRKATRREPDVETLLYLVNALVEADSIPAAELVATTAKKNFPNSADAYFALGVLYAKYKPQPVLELAKDNLEKTIEMDPSKILAHFALAEVYWRMANRESDQELGNELFKRSLLEWNKVGQLDPRNARAWFEQGKIFYLSKKYKESIGALQRYRELRPGNTGNAIATWYLGKSFFELQACDSAKVYLTEAVQRIDSLKGEASMMLGKCNVITRQWANAAAAYKTAIDAGVNTNRWEPSDVWYFGTSLVMSGDTARAIAVMTEAAERDPKNCGFMFRFGLLLQSKNMSSTSTRILQQRLANCKDSLDGKINLFIGNNFFADSVLDSAIYYYERSLALDANSFTTNRLAETYAAAGQDEKARALYGQVVALGQQANASPNDVKGAVQAIIKLNGMDLTAKDYASIISRSQTGLTLDSKNAWLMLYMAFGYQGQANTESACKWYKETLKVDPANDIAKKNAKTLGC